MGDEFEVLGTGKFHPTPSRGPTMHLEHLQSTPTTYRFPVPPALQIK